jgi:hypothetical protein
MPENIRVYESESKASKSPKLQVHVKREESARDGLLPPIRREVPLTRDLILRLIEIIKQV